MNAELKAKWIAALESGDYKHGKGHLRNADDTYCCIGVLHDVAFPGQWAIEPLSNCYTGRDGATAMLQSEDIVALGLNADQLWNAASINDGLDVHDYCDVITYIKEQM